MSKQETQELKCIQEINNFINEYKKIIKKDTEIYLLISHFNVFDKTMYPNERKYIELTSDTVYKEFKNCPITKIKHHKIISKLNIDFIYKEDNIKYQYEQGYIDKIPDGYVYPYYKTNMAPLSPIFFNKMFKLIEYVKKNIL